MCWGFFGLDFLLLFYHEKSKREKYRIFNNLQLFISEGVIINVHILQNNI